MLGHTCTLKSRKFAFLVTKFKLVVDEILTFVVAAKWDESHVLSVWNLNITAVTEQVAVCLKLVLNIMKY